MLDAIKDMIRAKLQTKPQKNHTLIEAAKMKKTTAKKVKMEAKGMPEMKGKSKMNKPPRKTTSKHKKD